MRTLSNHFLTRPAPSPELPSTPWTTRFLAVLGFLLAFGVISMAISRQMAIFSAQAYMHQHYNTTSELPVRDIRGEFLSGTSASGKPLPPLGFCWTIDLETSGAEAQITINPWTHDIVEWHAQL